MFLTAEVRLVDGTTVGVLVLSEKEFRSGKLGFFGQSKMTHKGQRYQAQCQLVAIAAKDPPQRKARMISMTNDHQLLPEHLPGS